ncbi:unnamed protein product [Rotaria sp. Silwood2]|nr:unnamed protein product [Rotaria sp. Silwood2]CAF4501508.1 unnamed protein product [Rotaria sp. Silwood2]
MSKQKSTTTIISDAAATSSTTAITNANNHAAMLPRPMRRLLQNWLLVWLDTSFDEFKDEYKKSMEHIRDILASAIIFTDVDECVAFLSDVENQKVFMILSDAVGQNRIPQIQECSHLISIYILCGNQSSHQEWTKVVPKVKGVYTQIEPICDALRIDHEICDRAMIPISFNRIDPLFMYTQLLKEALLDIEDDDAKCIKEFAEYCRLEGDTSEKTLEKIEKEYCSHSAIWWYTGPYFIYSMLNCGLRRMDVDIILKMGFFIRHLHNHIAELHRQQQDSVQTNFQVFRGQGLSIEDFDKMKKTKGGLMSFNNFLSTSRNRDISLNNFAQIALMNQNSVGILFIMNIDTAICTQSSTPFAELSESSYFKNQEEEILFSTHTIFRIDSIERIEDDSTDRLWQVHLTIVGNQDDDFNKLTAHLREECMWATGWARFAHILIQLGEPAKAEHLYQMLLENATSDKQRSDYNLQLGAAYQNMGEYSKALSSYERSLEINKIALPPNHSELATCYNNIGGVYYRMGEIQKALLFFEQALQIQKIALPANHPSLASCYSNIGTVYANMDEYPKALLSYEQSLEIRAIALPPNHPDLAMSYNNIGNVYVNMGQYSKALSSYQQAFEIRAIALPPNHPDLAGSYNNIGLVYCDMGEYSKALSMYERSLEIQKIALPSNHPLSATSYNNIGKVYDKIGKLSEALSSYERAFEIDKATLPPNHPHLANYYNKIGMLHTKMGDYAKALSSYEQSLEIHKIALPLNHPDLAASYNNIGVVYFNMGEYPKALSLYERSLEIRAIALPSNHPSLAASYDNIGRVYDKVGELSEALSSYERALEIKKITLPLNHPDLTKSYGNIGIVYEKMGEYSKALSFLELTHDIFKQSLPPTHPDVVKSQRDIENLKKKL